MFRVTRSSIVFARVADATSTGTINVARIITSARATSTSKAEITETLA
jgi:hypothetical protein